MELALNEDEQKVKEIDALDLLGARLNQSLTSTITERSTVEQRWLEDLQQYLGEYDEVTMRKLKGDTTRASVFLNITRVMVNQAESQLADLLFPAEEKNWGIGPTPNPDIDADLNDDSPATDENGEPMLDGETQEPILNSELAGRAREIAREQAMKMEREIHDQLVECDYNGQARKGLHWSAIFGTAVFAGPEKSNGFDTRFTSVADPENPDKTIMVLDRQPANTPSARAVAPWDFYPDMSASCLDECEYIYERTYLTRKQLRQLARDGDKYLKRNIKRLMVMEPKRTHCAATGAVDSLRRLTGSGNSADMNRYEVWTYSGPIDKASLIEAGIKIDPEDPMDEYDGRVIFSGNIPIKVTLNSLDSEEWAYSVWAWQKDDFCIFGFGVPHLCRNEQRIVNTAWRMMLDNASKSAGPQVVAKRNALSPEDGSNTITPWKLWWADETVTDVRNAFTVFEFPSVQAEIGNILQMAKGFLNETAGLPPVVGQGQGQTPNTMGGMAMLMNSSNTDRRRQVRDWDDNVTKPLIRRFYHWNMQYNENDDIKGDYEVHARGTSALLLREQQAINLMALLDKYAAHPVLQGSLKSNATLRKIVQALHISPDELVKTEEEIKAELAAAQEQGEAPDPQIVVEEMRTEQIRMRSEYAQDIENLKAELEKNEREADRQLRRDLALMDSARQDKELQMEALKHAEANGLKYQQVLADLKKHRWRLNQDRAKFEKELQVKAAEGETANYGLE